MRVLAMSALVLLAGSPAGAPDPSLIREERTVMVGGVAEQWRLVWRTQPESECGVESLGWITCPCSGFEFGERGELDLVRLRAGHEVERLALTPFFAANAEDTHPMADLARYPAHDNDSETAMELGSDALETAVKSRPAVTIMKWRDYDHDGQATEFFLQTWAQPCGKQVGIVVGVSRREPKLHVFSSVEHPNQPLFLHREHWRDLARARDPLTRIEWECGDHGSDTRTMVVLRAKAGEIHATRRDYECKDDGSIGALVEEKVL